jgi:hypothetical protein
MSAARTAPQSTSGLWLIAGFVRAVGVGALAGAAAGVLIGGLGGRLAMRIVAIVAGPETIGALTANGNRVGEFTAEGTLALLIFGGLLPGLVGGPVYALVRPWLAGMGRWRGITFGFLLLATFGFVIIESTNPDFRGFGVPLLNVLLFALLFLLFGVVVASLGNRFDRALPGVPPSQPVRIRTLGAYALVTLAAALIFLILGAVVRLLLVGGGLPPGDRLPLPALVLAGVVAAVVLARVLGAVLSHNGAPGTVSSGRSLVSFTGLAMLAILVVAGLVMTLQSIREILLAA